MLPGVMGCIQATEVVKIALGLGQVLAGRLLKYDALKMVFTEATLERDEVQSPPVSDLVDYQGFCGAPSSAAAAEEAAAPEPFQRISVEDAVKRFGDGWAPYVLDVRMVQEADIVSLPFADRLCPHRSVAKIVGELPAEGDILVHCKVGGRSAKACRTLAEAGVEPERLINMDGGIIAWAKRIDPSMPIY